MKTNGQEWQTAHQKLLNNLQQQDFSPQDDNAVNIVIDGKKTFLPAYIPYIGKNYFSYRPRVLCYAINQNLSSHVPWTQELLHLWGSDLDEARDRLNKAAARGEQIPVKPYMEGFIPLIALIAIQKWILKHGGNLPGKVDDVLSVTNFIKFSTHKDAADSSIPKLWWTECASRFVEREIEILQPDIIIGVGNKVFEALNKALKPLNSAERRPKLLKCHFPTRIASNKSRVLKDEESEIWRTEIQPLIRRVRKPKEPSRHDWKIERFPGYFVDVCKAWSSAEI